MVLQSLKGRYSLLLSFITAYLCIAILVRTTLLVLSFSEIQFSFGNIVAMYGIGSLYNILVSMYVCFIYMLYLLCIPTKLIGTLFDKIVTFFVITIMLFIVTFSFLAEFPFWEEFGARFNFIAVDYLIYTYEVIENINQSYPIPVIIIVIIALIIGILYLFKKRKVYKNTFTEKPAFKHRLLVSISYIGIMSLGAYFVTNKWAEFGENKYANEIAKDGIHSFFAAYISNELDYNTFYPTIDNKKAFSILKNELKQANTSYTNAQEEEISRLVKNDTTQQTPNIILVTIESFSAEFMQFFGNKNQLTPNIDKLSQEGIFFTNLYATGTRTVRGMEALTLSVPPTPGNSIVRRPNNNNIFSIATILKEKNYDLKFIYGGDGYFDNMNTFFGGQGFDIVDRYRGNSLSEDIKTNRYVISDKEVTFENAWGICDEDIYKQSIKFADKLYGSKKPFFQFIMTTSNHKPYTFPTHKIKLPQGNREAAVMYTDYALGKFIQDVKTKPWFSNTVFVIIADHCASSAGKWELNIPRHHIPAIVYNLPYKNQQISKLCSQIDIMPTVFSLLQWNYTTELYGKDILHMKPYEERALIGNYRTLGLLRNNIFTQINDRKQVQQYIYKNENLLPIGNSVDSLRNLTISYYQTASNRFKNGQMKVK